MWKIVWRLPKKLKIKIAYDPIIPLLGIYPKKTKTLIQKDICRGVWVAQLVQHLPSAQATIPGSRDRAPHQAPCSAGNPLLSLPFPSAHDLSLSQNKQMKSLKKKKMNIIVMHRPNTL